MSDLINEFIENCLPWRVFLFIDHPNIKGIVGKGKEFEIEAWSSIISEIKKEINYRIAKIYWYMPKFKSNQGQYSRYIKQKKFIEEVPTKIPGSIIRMGYFGKRVRIEKAVDTQLVADVIELAYKNRFDIAVIASGDGDFLPVVEPLKACRKRIIVFGLNAQIADTLRKKITIHTLDHLMVKNKGEGHAGRKTVGSL